MALKLDPTRHKVLENELSRWLIREFGPDLFVYKHEGTGARVIAKWSARNKGEFDELLTLEGDIELDRDSANLLRGILLRSPQDRAKEMYDRAVSQERAELRKQEDGQRQSQDDAKTARRLLHNQVAKDDPRLRALADGMSDA